MKARNILVVSFLISGLILIGAQFQPAIRAQVSKINMKVIAGTPLKAGEPGTNLAIPTGTSSAFTPVLRMTGTQVSSNNGKHYRKFNLVLCNRADFPAEFFKPAPHLPPCGANKHSARAWVTIHDRATHNEIYAFCALASPNDLGHLWFSVEEGQSRPSHVYVKVTDRQTGVTYTSNSVATATSQICN